MAKRVQQLDFQPAALRRYVEENFSLDRMVAEYISLYSEAVKQDSQQLGVA